MVDLAQSLECRSVPEPNTGCWLWTGGLNPDGYGKDFRGQAHRLSYETFVGSIPPGLTIDHLCRVRRCINPAHLEPVPALVNTARQPKKERCPQGHRYDSTVTNKGRHGNPIVARSCSICRRDKVRRYMSRKKACVQ